MGNRLQLSAEWMVLKEYLEIYGDFVLKEPRVTDEVIREIEEEIKDNTGILPSEVGEPLYIKKIFNDKMLKHVICDDGNQCGGIRTQIMEEFYNKDFKAEPIDDTIKQVIIEMTNLYRQRRIYEHTFRT